MLLPSRTTVEAQIAQIPTGSVLTTDRLRRALANQFGVQGTCPVTTKKALQAIANDPASEVPFWRVVKKNGELMSYYPGGVASQAARLVAEGLVIDQNRKTPRVENLRNFQP
jgi:alkylated DNA nucleotide flippase Atl1